MSDFRTVVALSMSLCATMVNLLLFVPTGVCQVNLYSVVPQRTSAEQEHKQPESISLCDPSLGKLSEEGPKTRNSIVNQSENAFKLREADIF